MASWNSALSHLECGRCGTRYDADQPRNLCTCGTPLLVRYDLAAVAATVSTSDIAGRPADLWRYRELLPYEAGAATAEPWENADTVAFGINVPSALGDFLILDAVRDTGGIAIAVDDADILASQAACAAVEGVLMCPEGAATLTAVEQLRTSGWLDGSEEVVVLNTGSDLKYPHTAPLAEPPLLAKDSVLSI